MWKFGIEIRWDGSIFRQKQDNNIIVHVFHGYNHHVMLMNSIVNINAIVQNIIWVFKVLVII